MKSSAWRDAGWRTISRRISLRRGAFFAQWVGLMALVALPAGALAQPAAGKRPDPKKGGVVRLPVPVPVGPKGAQVTGKKGGAPGTPTPAGPAAKAGPAAPAKPIRWTATAPDQMVDQALARARRGGDDAIAGLVVAASLDERASFGRVRTGLRSIGVSNGPVADEAKWLMLWLSPEPGGGPWPGAAAVKYDAPADPNGLVKAFAILGPFQDTGGGLMRREGPEAEGQSFSDTQARYSWGVFDVSWRRALPASSTARGVPLDLYIHPRSESCSYLASKVTIPAAPSAGGAASGADKGVRPVIAHVAAAGAVRLIWDGVDVAASEDQHPRLVLDRLAARIEATPGEHLVAVKVCSGAVADEGRVRVRFTTEDRKPISIASSSDLRGLRIASPKAAESAAPADAAKGGAAKGGAAKGGAAKDVGAKVSAAKGGAAKGGAAKGQGEKGAAVKKPGGPFTRVQTALERALNLTDAATIEQVLTAGIVRTLGGAEDSRSPRAPGLLDRVARTPEVAPDALAMAGWISPFGSNRSGWLNLARARGAEAKDAMTEAFAQRRLVASNLSSNLVDWAMSTMREEPLKSASDTEARLIKAMAKRQAGGSGLARAALEDLLAISEEQKARTPISVWSEIAAAARSKPDIALRAARRVAETRADARDAAFVRAFRSESGPALESAAALYLAQQTTADDVILIARELYDAGRYPWAREAFYLATQLAPNRAVAFQGLASARKAAITAEKLPADVAAKEAGLATAALARARDLEPGDALLKAELAWRTGAGPAAAEGRTKLRDEQYIPAPATFLERGKRASYKKGEIFDRQLHWVRVVTYHPDKRVSQLMHYAREIVIEPRTEGDLYERGIPAEGADTELLLARVHKKDGSIAMPEEQGTGGGAPFVRWPELKTGDVVEVAVRSWTAGPVGRRGDAPFYFIDYVGSTDTHPILYNEVVVESPQSSPLAIDVLHGKPDRDTTETKDGRSVRRMVWDNPPSIPEEPLAPRLSESLPVVVGSTFASWHDFREWYRGAVAGFTEPDDQVRRLALDLTKGKKTREEKLKAIFDFVADDIRYVNYVSGEWWLPNRPQELLARRQGDCDDKAMLLITLLRSIGIEATEVLVQTRYTGEPSLLRSEKAAIPIFDHGIAYLPGQNGGPGMWLDATSPQSRLGPLPSMDARTVALFVHDGPAKIVETPASSPSDHGIDAEWTIKLSPTGAGDLVASEKHMGDAAFELRTNLGQSDARAQWVEQYLASGWFPTVQVKPAIEFASDLPNGAAVLRYEARSEGLARREGDELAVPVSEGNTLTSQLAPLVKRTLPVVLPPGLAPGHQTRTISIVAPPGFAFADLPPGGEEQGGEFGSARLEFKRGAGANTVVVKRTVVFDLSTIPLEKYPAWRGWLQRVDGLMHRMVRLVPAKP
jgi:hypothetical protein